VEQAQVKLLVIIVNSRSKRGLIETRLKYLRQFLDSSIPQELLALAVAGLSETVRGINICARALDRWPHNLGQGYLQLPEFIQELVDGQLMAISISRFSRSTFLSWDHVLRWMTELQTARFPEILPSSRWQKFPDQLPDAESYLVIVIKKDLPKLELALEKLGRKITRTDLEIKARA
jgi:hypothetical protein